MISTTQTSNLVAISFDDELQADKARKVLEARTKEHLVDVQDAVVVVKNSEGELKTPINSPSDSQIQQQYFYLDKYQKQSILVLLGKLVAVLPFLIAAFLGVVILGIFQTINYLTAFLTDTKTWQL